MHTYTKKRNQNIYHKLEKLKPHAGPKDGLDAFTRGEVNGFLLHLLRIVATGPTYIANVKAGNALILRQTDAELLNEAAFAIRTSS